MALAFSTPSRQLLPWDFENVSDLNPAMALVTVTNIGRNPVMNDAALQLGVGVEDIDATFGLVPIDVSAGLYCVQVVADSLPAGFERRDPYQGPFANPGVAPFGQLQSGVKADK